ncbi:SspB family protein [Roseicella aquatilis]|uniref:Stringent starvation protein B n=1 Tax=Roseicella aquatilis TaxID=2527868 RepID=A0A4R4DQM5_9PROT|nr:ClpXP protease specificity-enhancing factor SspB [Roseicella aquatilis]TCZ64424.1 hypothetical protein EXY23_07190 [Roseicella aquatilis]
MNETVAPGESLLPYSEWAEEALRAVVVEALDHAGRNGLPGEHHFYVTFRTDHPGVAIPGHLKARYPQEMTIVLQHKFWDLKVDRTANTFSVGLSFGGVPAMLVIPLKAVTAFADPQVRFGLRFPAPEPVVEAPAPAEQPGAEASAEEAKPQVVSLDAFRRRRE